MTDNSELLRGVDKDSSFGQRTASWQERLVWMASDWSLLPQKWRQKLRKRFARKVKGPFDLQILEMKFRLYPAENYCDRVLFGRGVLPEREEHEALDTFIKPGMVFVDIGANVGSYSIFVGRKFPQDVTLVAFEPHPRTYAKLVANLGLNNLPTENVINAGVGPERTQLKLWSDGGSNIGHTSMLKEGTSNPVVSVDVPVVPLVEVLAERGISHIDLLKIDIEGFEDQALAPFFDKAIETLWPDRILIEVAHQHLWQRDLTQILNDGGYKLTFKTQENRLYSRIDI